MAVQRVFVMKKREYSVEATGLLGSLKENLGIETLNDVAILNRYDVEGLSPESLKPLLNTIFAEPMVDDLFLETYPFNISDTVFAVEYLPGQYDQRADSGEQCVKVMSGASDVRIRCAKVYILKGNITTTEKAAIKNLIINKIDQREASMAMPETLAQKNPVPEPVAEIDGFLHFSDKELAKFIAGCGLAMNLEDIKTVKKYFESEKRNPTETEIKLLDTYWSDHCRHTTFNTVLTDVKISDGDYKSMFEEALNNYFKIRGDVYGKASERPVTLMDMAVINAKYARKHGMLDNLEVSEENNACSIEVDVNTTNGKECWLLQFKNETHNHPTEIEPYGGAATCLGGAIRDPLSGRAYVYHSMRITGSGDPRCPISETMEGKLPQRKITKEAARGFSSYGNQIGLATGYVQEFYHDGFKAKRLEAGAVVGAVPKANVVRERPEVGDKVILVGGRTGRDGIGGATGSSKEHDIRSIDICGAEVQKGNAPEEHKIQRLFRKKNVSLMMKKCNDFGAGGVGVAIGELADGLLIDLNAVPKKYEGLTGTEIAIAESQERMAAVVSAKDAARFIEECGLENLEATVVAEVTDNRRLIMRHNGRNIVNISRDFLDSSGAARFQDVIIEQPEGKSYFDNIKSYNSFAIGAKEILSNLNVCSQKGMVEMFDSTIGGGSVLMPFGGKTGNCPAEYMAAKFPVEGGDTTTISIMASGYNPYLSSWSPFHGGMYAVTEAVAKVIAAGGKLADIRLSLQEYFERLGDIPKKWGKPASALLGAMEAQYNLDIAAIGGKDSMSGTFRDKASGLDINVPPTLICFAVAPSDYSRSVAPEFKSTKGDIYLIKTGMKKDHTVDFGSFKNNIAKVSELIEKGLVKAIYTVKAGGILEALAKMSLGNMIGFKIEDSVSLKDITTPLYGSFIVHCAEGDRLEGENIIKIGATSEKPEAVFKDEILPISEIFQFWKTPIESVFPSQGNSKGGHMMPMDYGSRSKLKKAINTGKPRVALIALPGTNCEYDTKRAFELAGSYNVEPFIFRNRTVREAEDSCKEFAEIISKSQILAIPGGFSAGDEPEGSGKFYVAVLKNKYIMDAVHNLLQNNDGLAIGICNGFQALIKSGLLTKGFITDVNKDDATLSFNTIGRHVSQMVSVRTTSVNSPWMAYKNIGDIDIIPVSHGEGRFMASPFLIDRLFANGQIISQYVDINGLPTMEAPFNPNGSEWAVEGICSPDGRVLGKMGHSERCGKGVHINCDYGNFDQKIFKSGVGYFTGEVNV